MESIVSYLRVVTKASLEDPCIDQPCHSSRISLAAPQSVYLPFDSVVYRASCGFLARPDASYAGDIESSGWQTTAVYVPPVNIFGVSSLRRLRFLTIPFSKLLTTSDVSHFHIRTESSEKIYSSRIQVWLIAAIIETPRVVSVPVKIPIIDSFIPRRADSIYSA